ncbi:MAG: SIS domain-containing protein [Blautia sp.]|jgi:glucosamine 6-phosphate synthetase-like amidotransferase/phosphosugar isomerase protein
MSKYENAMCQQVFSLPELIRSQYEDLEPKTRTVLSFQEIFNIQRIVLTGCGDSYAAAMATKHAFEMLTGIPTEVVTAIELSRFYCEKHMGVDCRNPMVISVSNSGTGARISEAVQRARMHGCYVLGITGDEASPLGVHSDKILKLNIPSFESAPGTRSYMVSVMALLLLAIRFGEVRGKYTMDQAMDYRYDIRDQGDLLEAMLPEMDAACLKVAKEWKDFPCYDFVGSGFDYATAWFGHAKILEATGKFAMHINAEEWFHLNFFARDARHMGTVVVGNTTSPGLSRTKEMVKYANVLKRPLVVITDGTKEDFDGEEAIYIRVPSPKYPISMPLTHFAPVCLIAGYISALIGEKYGRGCEGDWEFAQGGAGVKNSEIIVK